MALTTYAELKAAIASWLPRSDLTTPIPDFIYLAEKDIEQRLRLNDGASVAGTLTAAQDYLDLPADCLEVIHFRLETDPIRELEVVSRRELTRLRQSNSSGIPQAMAVVSGVIRSFAITAFATAVAGTKTRVTAAAHGVAVATKCRIDGTTSYDNYWIVEDVNVNDFRIPDPFVADEAPATGYVEGMRIYFDDAAGAHPYTVFYRQKFAYLKDGADGDSNWILSNYPSLLLYGSLVQACPYIQNDERAPIWGKLFEEALRDCKLQQWRRRLSGGELRMKVDFVVP